MPICIIAEKNDLYHKKSGNELEINLWDLPKDKIYINFNSWFYKELKGKIESQFKTVRNFRHFFNNSSKRKVCEDNFYNWLNAKTSIPLWALERFQEIFYLKREFIESNILHIKGQKSAAKLKHIKFPIKISKEFSRIISHLLGDGCISKYGVSYHNKNKRIIDQFKNDCHKVFGRFKTRLYYRKKVFSIQMPTIIGHILSTLGITFFHNKSEIPKIILDSNKEIKKYFISALYDDEGAICNRVIRIEMTSKKIIKQLVEILKEFNIFIKIVHSRKRDKKYSRSYFFNISGRNDLLNFYKNIGFSHDEKQKKLLKKINDYKVLQRKKGQAKNEIIRILSKGERGTGELKQRLKIKSSCLSSHLKKLQIKNIVNVTKGKIERDKKGKIIKVYEHRWKMKR